MLAAFLIAALAQSACNELPTAREAMLCDAAWQKRNAASNAGKAVKLCTELDAVARKRGFPLVSLTLLVDGKHFRCSKR